MTESETNPPSRAARRRWRRVHTIMAAGVIVAVVVGGVVYLTRRAIARELLVGWLESRGVPADVQFREFEFGGFTARVRAGPEMDPDVSVERVEVRYGFTGFWSGEAPGVRVTSVKLYRPVVKGVFRDGKLKLGTLDPLIEEFTSRPPKPEGPQPRVEIHRGVVRLDTDYGLLKARADARLADGRLMAMDAQLDPAALKGEGLAARLGEVSLRLATTRGRVDLLLTAPVEALEAQGFKAQGGRVRLSVQGPYPDTVRKRGEGRVMARLEASAARATLGQDGLDEMRLVANFDGATRGWIETLVLEGDGDLQVGARGGQVAGFTLAGLTGQASLGDVRWTRAAGDVVSAEISSRLAADRASGGDIRLSDARGEFGGLAAFDGKRVDLALRGALASRGGWSGLGPVAASDPAETAALKRALADFQLTASSIALNASRDGVSVGLGQPAVVRTASGGELKLSQASGRPIYADGAGGFDVLVRGGGLPEASLAVSRYRLTKDGIVATAALQAKGGFAPVSQASLDAAGEVRIAAGGVAFVAARCMSLSAGHVELGDSDLEKAAGEFCPTPGAPLLSLKDGGWRVRGQARGVAAELPFLEARLSQAAGPVDLSGAGAAINGQVAVAAARLDDTAADTRFHPVRASGQARARNGGWTADFALTDLAGRRLAAGDLRHGADGRGVLAFDTGMLTFEDGGLQPVGLSPLAAIVASPANGRARFDGQIAWAPGSSTSHGTLNVERMDFVSPMGPVQGLAGRAEFDSLIPLTAAPGQVLRAQAINSLVPLTDVDVVFGLDPDAVSVGGARLAMGGGTLSFEPFRVPFKPGEPWSGVLNIEGVQVKELVEASPFGDRVDLEARLTGRVPFEVRPEGVRVAAGRLRAIEPGRLSILREALVPVAAQGGEVVGAAVEGAPTVPVAPVATETGEVNAFSEFAYQAMEHLAFDTLDAEVNSLENGRLGVLMRLKGEHTPPQKQEIRLTLMDLIRRNFLNRSLPLPSGTKVDLTLDTSLNLDQILKDFGEYQALRGSQAVQPE
ncbi:YdbH domain-containing protein [Phenylobacterium sp. NIBR 498073]|uniref:intermembrane phospholipid transport protein YdbH family protein n=1 Tax=Phenylobacterium sp. NIBR 498073 TaxID=3015177 RepID=UPI0022B4AE7A|nr:YdbH domain-containing protein [Phenylobacterium sp. NIBR 498073]WGU39973.1 YdbH domain-containing protein [Phenylobacterium sp. NIBR 498073]